MCETILFEKCGAVAKLALNRPKKLNAFDGIMHEDLYDALDGAAQDGEVRCVVLQGEGKDFSARADLAQIAEGTDGDPDLGGYLRSTYSRLVSRMVTVEKPIVVALHGPVDGAGVAIALACDLRIAAENAKFSVAFIKIALMPDAGVSFLLPHIVGLGRAMEMSMLGYAVEAGEALRIGLVNKVVPAEMLPEVIAALAERSAKMPTSALGKVKHSHYTSFESDFETALAREAEGQTFCGYTRDYKEGVAAFFEGREPNFTGR